jgi:hypothetical protein
VTALIAHRDVSAWWLMPIAVVGLLVASIWRTARSSR